MLQDKQFSNQNIAHDQIQEEEKQTINTQASNGDMPIIQPKK